MADCPGARYIRAIGLTESKREALAFAEQWRDSPAVYLALEAEIETGAITGDRT
jgi:hypothetical protein